MKDFLNTDVPAWSLFLCIIIAIVMGLVAGNELDVYESKIKVLEEQLHALTDALYHANRPRPLGAFNLVCYIVEE